MTMRIFLPILVCLLMSLPARSEPTFDHLSLANKTIENVIKPRAAAFVASAKELETQLVSACQAPSRDKLADVKSAFVEVLKDYARLELLRFGPTRQKNRQEKLLLYPDPKGLVRRQVETVIAEQDDSVLSPETLSGKSVALQGFHAFEYVFHQTDNHDIILHNTDSGFRCAYASAIASNINAIASEIAAAWSDPQGYAQLMRVPGDENPAYLDQSEVTYEIVMAIATGLETIRDVRLAAPLGLRDQKIAPTIEIMPQSGLMSVILAANIEGLRLAYADSGLHAQLSQHEPALADLVTKELVTAESTAKKVSTQKQDALHDPAIRRNLLIMGFPLKNARHIFGQLVAKAAKLSVGFNAGDGD